MNKLTKYIDDLYRLDPTKLVRFANESYRLIHVKRRWWKGRRVIKGVEVKLDEKTIDEEAATRSQWKMCPNKLKDEFTAFEKSLDQVIGDYCFAGHDEESKDSKGIAVLLRGGTYAIPTTVWPRAQQILRTCQQKWSEAADAWCTSDGYAEFHKQVEEKIGTENYNKAKNLIPNADTLRASFGLLVTELPVVIAKNVDSPTGDEGRAHVLGEILECAIRNPRMDAHKTWSGLAVQLIEVDGDVVKPRYVVRKIGEDDTPSNGYRSVRKATVLEAREMADRTVKCGKAIDVRFQAVLNAVMSEFPDTIDTAAVKARELNKDDDLAVRVGKLLSSAATVAADEESMCDALAVALA